MPDRVSCPRCDESFPIEADAARAECPVCGLRFAVGDDQPSPTGRAPDVSRGTPPCLLATGLLVQAVGLGLQLFVLLAWLAVLGYQLDGGPRNPGPRSDVVVAAFGLLVLGGMVAGVVLNLVAASYFTLARESERARPLGLALALVALMQGILPLASLTSFARDPDFFDGGFGPRGAGVIVLVLVVEGIRLTLQGWYLYAVATDLRRVRSLALGLAIATPVLLLAPWVFAFLITASQGGPSGDGFLPMLTLSLFFLSAVVVLVWSFLVLMQLRGRLLRPAYR